MKKVLLTPLFILFTLSTLIFTGCQTETDAGTSQTNENTNIEDEPTTPPVEEEEYKSSYYDNYVVDEEKKQEMINEVLNNTWKIEKIYNKGINEDNEELSESYYEFSKDISFMTIGELKNNVKKEINNSTINESKTYYDFTVILLEKIQEGLNAFNNKYNNDSLCFIDKDKEDIILVKVDNNNLFITKNVLPATLFSNLTQEHWEYHKERITEQLKFKDVRSYLLSLYKNDSYANGQKDINCVLVTK